MKGRAPVVVAMDMGYGHLRAAASLAAAAGTDVVEADRAPLADAAEQASWDRARTLYVGLSRWASYPLVGIALRRLLDGVTAIPKMRGGADLRRPNAAARMLRRMASDGLGRGLVDHLRSTGRPLVSTFYAPAIVAAQAGLEDVTLVVTDSDVNRVWVPEDPETPLRYCAPTERAAERLRRYGVPAERVRVTGFPLPPALVGEARHDAARRNLAARIARLDASGAFRRAAGAELAAHDVDPAAAADGPPHVVLAIGGAGAQVALAREVLRTLAPGARSGAWRLTLVAGTRGEVAAALRDEIGRNALGDASAQVLHEATFPEYLARFEATLASADVLWTKPSEMTFYAALGLPLLLATPLGAHEKSNRRWALERGAAADARTGRTTASALESGLADGSLAAAAWNGFLRMPRDGTRSILR